jgi:hypothetical protein
VTDLRADSCFDVERNAACPRVTVAPATERTWRRAIAAAAWPLPEQTPEWIAAICADGRWTDASREYRLGDGRSFVLPLVRRAHTVGRATLLASPPPAWGIGGLVGPDLDAGVLEAVVDDLRSCKAARVSIRIDPRVDALWQAATNGRAITVARRAHVIDLGDGVEHHLASLNKSTRKAIRKADRNGVQVVVDHTPSRLEHHYALYLRSVERWAATQHEPLSLALWRARRRDPIDKLRAMATHMAGRFRHVIAYVDGRPAASTIILLGGTTRDTRGAIDRELAQGTGANDAVQWRAIEEAYSYGSRWYNLGESGGSTSLAAFKERFGATPIDHSEYRFERIPFTRVDAATRSVVKRSIGFRDH